jgi:hypothetical protein
LLYPTNSFPVHGPNLDELMTVDHNENTKK